MLTSPEVNCNVHIKPANWEICFEVLMRKHPEQPATDQGDLHFMNYNTPKFS